MNEYKTSCDTWKENYAWLILLSLNSTEHFYIFNHINASSLPMQHFYTFNNLTASLPLVIKGMLR